MKEYIKPTFDIVELRINEEINAPSSYKTSASFYKKGVNGWTNAQLKQMALQTLEADTASNF